MRVLAFVLPVEEKNVTVDQSRTDHGARPGLVRGWMMVAIAFCLQGIGIGSLYMSGLLVSELRSKMHLSTGEVLMWTAALLLLAMAALMPVGGYVLRRLSVKALATGSMLSLLMGYVGLAYSDQVWHLAIIFGVFLPVAAAGSIVSANTLVSNWFVTGRGLALAVATAGIMTGGAIVPPFAAYLLTNGGIAHMSFVFATIGAALLPVTALLIIDAPEQRGWHPDGLPHPPVAEPSAHAAPANGWTPRSILGHGGFWVVMAMIAIFSAITTAILSNFVPFAESLGIAKDKAAWLVSASSLAGAVGMIFLGSMLNKVGPRTIVGVPMLTAGTAAGLMAWWPEYPLLLTASVFIGLANGATSVSPGIIAGQYFGRAGFSFAFGVAMFVQTILTAFAIPIFGAGYDALGRYEPILFSVAGTMLVLGLLGRLLPHRFHSVDGSAPHAA